MSRAAVPQRDCWTSAPRAYFPAASSSRTTANRARRARDRRTDVIDEASGRNASIPSYYLLPASGGGERDSRIGCYLYAARPEPALYLPSLSIWNYDIILPGRQSDYFPCDRDARLSALHPPSLKLRRACEQACRSIGVGGPVAILGFGSAFPPSAFPPKDVQPAPGSTGRSARRAVSEAFRGQGYEPRPRNATSCSIFRIVSRRRPSLSRTDAIRS